MIPFDRFEKWFPELDESAKRYLNAGEYQAYRFIPDGEKMSQLKAILEKPIAKFTQVNEVYFRFDSSGEVG